MEVSAVKELIEKGLPEAIVEVTGDGRHFDATVISAEFEGLSLIKRHRLVLNTVQPQIESDELHALAIKAKTPE